MGNNQLARSYGFIKYQSSRHKILSVLIIVATLGLIVRSYFNSPDHSYLFDLNDGRGTTGFGITRGGTGNQGYQRNHRTGGLPPNARREFVDKDPSVYDEYDVDEFYGEDTEQFDKDLNKIVIILGANLEGGVNKWKGPNEWSIERSSIVNKRHYANLHGYDLVIKDYTKAKKYSREHREGWQKIDILKDVFSEYKNGDWFWYIDLYTLVMEPEVSLENLILNHIDQFITRDLNYYNPKQLELEIPFVNYEEPINLILSQDCGGFNLQSFFIKKSKWSLALLDILFDPVIYLKNHKTWTNDEKDAFEYYYNHLGWVRSRVGFVPTRLISSLPKGACPGFQNDERFFYNETTRDFLVNMMGCEFNRNCWDEMEFFKDLSDSLHRNWFQKLFNL